MCAFLARSQAVLIRWSRDRPHLESRCSRSFCLYGLPLGLLLSDQTQATIPSRRPGPPAAPPTEWPQGVISTAQTGKQNSDLLHSATYPPRRVTTRAGLCPLARIVIFSASLAAKGRHGKDFHIWTKHRALTRGDLPLPLLSAWETDVKLDGNGRCHSSRFALLRGEVKTVRDRPAGPASLSWPAPRHGL